MSNKNHAIILFSALQFYPVYLTLVAGGDRDEDEAVF